MKKESNVQKTVQLAASTVGTTTWRNNTGAYRTEDGHFIRYGIPLTGGGSDLLGITPVVITADMVGQTVGVFTALEIKTKTGKARQNQLEFIDFVLSKGGKAGIARSAEDAIKIIRN